MITTENESRSSTVRRVGELMMAAARTAPKARGVDNLGIAMLTGEDIDRLADRLEKDGTEQGLSFYVRDAKCIRSCQAVILIGTRLAPLGLDCGYCGFPDCAAKNTQSPLTPCVFNSNDLGIALGSAVSVAADNRIDSRIMYSAGTSARELGFLEDCAYIIAVPLSCGAKSPFFDRPAL